MLYELTMLGTYFNQQIVNRFNYLMTGTPAAVSGSFGLMDAFGAIDTGGVFDDTKPFFRIMYALSSSFVVNSIVARACALYDPVDFYERPFVTPYAGTNSGQAMSPTSAYGFRTNRVRLDIDRGTKRFVGVTETQVDAGGVIAGAALTALGVVADSMSEIIEYEDEGATLQYAPVVVAKQEYTTPSGKRAYRYYSTLATQLEHVATSILWQPYATVRTQNSRQYGKGS